MLKTLKKYKFAKENFSILPQSFGVYIFHSENAPLYIGKSVNLRQRVRSYTYVKLTGKTSKMISQTAYFSFISVSSEIEALLLEAKLVNKLQTPFNIQLKDDKHPLYIRVSNNKYPQVLTSRKIAPNSNNLAVFGPFPSSQSVKKTLSLVRKIFPFSQHLPGKRPCIYSQMGLCNPCPTTIENAKNKNDYKKLKDEYDNNIKMIIKFLNGEIEKVKVSLIKEMKKYSKDEKFEESGKINSQLKSIEYITSQNASVASILKNPNFLEDIQNEQTIDLKETISKYVSFGKLERIECFDVAHLSGTFPTASMVTFINGIPEKSLYRHFKIRQKRKGDDYASLKEVAKRRVNHFSDWGKPDLVIVDGGKPQVSSFVSVFKDRNIPVIGLAKQTNTLIVPPKSSGDKFISLKLKRGPALNLVQHLRDESHRFARRLHHKLIKRSLFQKT